MPTENERKFVLDLDSLNQFKEISEGYSDIIQGYLVMSKGMSLRVRQAITENKIRRTMTFKQKAKGRVIEIEKKINHDDFEDLWFTALNKLEKIRFFKAHENYLWEIDFFRDHDNNFYFAQAEVELPENEIMPATIPEFIKTNLLYKVPRFDDKFSSKRLADPKHAKRLLHKIKEEQCKV